MAGRDPEAAEAKAELWLKQNGFNTLPIDVFAIAEKLDIMVAAKADCDAGVSGMLLRHGDESGILYATHVKSIGFQRFSVAHELGHYLLEGHAEQLFPEGVSVHQSQAGFVSADIYEREADHFASGLLMPDGPFRSLLRRSAEGLHGVEELAEKCLTSLVSAQPSRFAVGSVCG
jgi:Zn-dependent peptidase ImmA (M78 family)